MVSEGYSPQYPNLSAYINERGQNNLALCALGPGSTYFARWRNGSWSSWGSEKFNAAISAAQSKGNVVKAIALGYGGSYIISYGNPSNSVWTGLGTTWNLMGHYPGLTKEHLRTTSIAVCRIFVLQVVHELTVSRLFHST